MKRIGALTIAVAMTVAACGGSNETVAEPDVQVDTVDDDGAFRLAGDDVQVINGCRIEPNTQCKGANLSNTDLQATILTGANLSGANLFATNLSQANLSNAELRDTILTGADLRFANLGDADLSGADLSGADVYVANLSGADLRFANLSGANLSGADLSGAKFCRTTVPFGSTRTSVRDDDC